MTRAVRRLLFALATVLLVLTVTFIGLHAAPGDPVALYLGPNADAASGATMRHQLGLDRPLPVQYVEWLGRFIAGDWGHSIAQARPVTRVVGDAIGPTTLLTFLSLLTSYVLGIGIGAFQALERRTPWDSVLTGITVFVQAIPAYVLALALVLVFAYGSALWGWPGPLRLPAMGSSSIGADFLPTWQRIGDAVRHLLLPLITLSAIGAAGIARYVRSATITALQQPAVRTARAKGLGERRVLARHALRTSLIPVITLAGLQLPALFSGVVFVETIFGWPGMGRVMVTAVLGRDYPVVMATTAVFAGLVVIGNLIADVAVALADPRVRS